MGLWLARKGGSQCTKSRGHSKKKKKKKKERKKATTLYSMQRLALFFLFPPTDKPGYKKHWMLNRTEVLFQCV